jgi:antitoxin ParD1/3/4
MPTRNVNLTNELDQFVTAKIQSGRYESVSEVVRAALRSLERDEREYEEKLKALRAAIKEGLASGIAEGNPIEEVRASLNVPKKR